MLYLHVSNRTENLLRHLGEILRLDQQPDIFAPELFLIQSQGMERMVAQTLADDFDCFCNFRFFLPRDFLTFVAAQLDLGISPDGYDRQILTWRIDALLGDVSEEVYRPVSHYLSGENSELKRFQLARQLANIFDQYQVLRADLLAAWEQGKLSTEHPAEGWQMALWRRLLAQPGGEMHRANLLHRVIECLQSHTDLSAKLPQRISVLGLHIMPPIFLEYLNSLARHMDIHLLLLSPCRKYWGNVESERAQIKRLIRSGIGEAEGGGEHHPLLGGLGGQGRDFHNLLLERTHVQMEFTSYDEPLGSEDYHVAPLLHRLQSDLLNDRVPDSGNINVSPDDSSLAIISCHSKLREIQVLKDYILQRLHDDPALELRDILVMAPDIQEYSEIIPAVFNDVQHSIADRSIRRQNALVKAFNSFIALHAGRFGWNEVFEIFAQEAVFPQFQVAATDLDQLRRWVVGSGIRWGLSAGQRQAAGYAAFPETSWRAGLERLLMGYAIDSEDCIDGVYPFVEIEGRAAQSLGGLCRFIDLLEEAFYSWRQDRTLAEWSELLLGYVQTLFGEGDSKDLVQLRSLLTEMSGPVGSFHTRRIDFSVIREWFLLTARESRSSSGFLRGKLTFCSMLPMRSIPFQVVCLLGLNDGVFPKSDRHETFDLMGTEIRPGDRSPRADDRYQFLEAIIAARSHLYISYLGQSMQTNEQIPPSVVVSELLELLETGYGLSKPVVHHPLHPFSRKYFTGTDKHLFSYNRYCCEIAIALEAEGPPASPWWQGSLAEKTETVTVSELLRFYRNPQGYFIRDRLGVNLNMGEELPEERELFALSHLDRYVINQELVFLGSDGQRHDAYSRSQADGRMLLGNSGKVAFAQLSRALEPFMETIAAQGMGNQRPDLMVDMTVGPYRLVGTLPNQYDNGVLLVRIGPLRGCDLLAAWLHHLIMVSQQGAKMTRLVATDHCLGFDQTAQGPSLLSLLDHFAEGRIQISPLFVEPALAYAEQLGSSRAQLSPLVKAEKTLLYRLENGYEPELELLFRGVTEGFLGAAFEKVSQEIMCPLWSLANGS